MDLAASHLRVTLSNEDRLTHVQRFSDHATLDAYTARTGLKVVEIETIEPESVLASTTPPAEAKTPDAGVGERAERVLPFQEMQTEPTPPEEARRLLVLHAKTTLADVLLRYAPQFDYDNAAMADALTEADVIVDAALSTAPAARPGDEVERVRLLELPKGWTYVRMSNGELRAQPPSDFVATPYAAAPAA